MGYEHNGKPLVDIAQQLVEFILHMQVKARRGLVKQQKLRLSHKRPGYEHALPLAAGESRERPGGKIR